MDLDHRDQFDTARRLQTILRESLRHGEYNNYGQGIPRPQIPPEKMEYIRRLIAAILEGRTIIATYNLVLLAVLAVFAILHIKEKRRCRRRWSAAQAQVDVSSSSLSSSRGGGSSSSSSINSTPGITTPKTPSGATKDVHVDLERLPLLGSRQPRPSLPSVTMRTRRLFSAWLEYQPRPLPIINRTLPSNSVSLFVVAWVALNVFFHFYRLPLGWDYFFLLADRAGMVFIVNLPLLYLLAAKNQPIKLLTGRSYEALNIFHRRVGEFMCFEAVVHFASMLLWRIVIEYEWLRNEDNLWDYFLHPIIALGIGAFVAYELLFLTSLGSFRQRWYELFLASHVMLQVLALGFLYLHFHTSKPYVKASLAIFLVDRIVWRLGLKSASITARLSVLPDGDTILLSANWDKPTSSGFLRWFAWPRQNIKHGWKPTDHVFLIVPVLGWTHSLQAHPFTIASAAPPFSDRNSAGAWPTHMWLSLLIRAQEGFTSDLLCYAQRHRSVSVRLEGPYGSNHALDMLRAADNAVLVAGGSGIAVTFPLVWALMMEEAPATPSSEDDGDDDTVSVVKRPLDIHNIPATSVNRRRRVHMVWIIHSNEHHLWIPKERLDELVAAGLNLVIPPPTALAGRPNVAGIVEGWIGEADSGQANGGETAVVVSGPDGLNRMVRNTCAEATGRGADVRVAVEKFGW